MSWLPAGGRPGVSISHCTVAPRTPQKFGIHLKEIDKEEHLYILICTRDSSARLLGK